MRGENEVDKPGKDILFRLGSCLTVHSGNFPLSPSLCSGQPTSSGAFPMRGRARETVTERGVWRGWGSEIRQKIHFSRNQAQTEFI